MSREISARRGRRRKFYSGRRESETMEKLARIYIEEAMTRALIRNCPSCRSAIVKTEGCDIVTCLCGVNFCYRCGRRVLECRLSLCRNILRTSSVQAGNMARERLRRRYPTLTFRQCRALFKQKWK
ncbi:hypothetical protein J6590_011180 [Homalodisca vitripennis]|nr:hypothetical protein J6590_011180 [Homalodisca vitripennis]